MMAATTPASREEDAAILEAIGKWLERDVRPHVHALEHDDVYPQDMVEQMKALGLFGATIGTAYGGLGLSATTYARIVQRVSEVWMSLSGIFNSHLIMAAAVERFGTPEQKQQFLPRFATGELRGGPGIDRARLRHRPAGDTHHRAPPHQSSWRQRSLCRERHQDLDLERHPRPDLRAPGQDRPGG